MTRCLRFNTFILFNSYSETPTVPWKKLDTLRCTITEGDNSNCFPKNQGYVTLERFRGNFTQKLQLCPGKSLTPYVGVLQRELIPTIARKSRCTLRWSALEGT
ncbi:hypothetical protein AVEN_132192-1 [Araneus ventricosus]|uniref:Uncharacterized protein n=1 Tax=Araneus ventricosus TaxID=182803 RepID=A0A4Y2FBG4_ARAVE|nr:hypothetical protein AVEN_132192-1 [Araneus ventricosus]